MRLIDDAEEARQIWQDADRRRYTAYLEVLNSHKESPSESKARTIRRFRQGYTDLWRADHFADIILDDGSYLEEVVCIGDCAMGVVVDSPYNAYLAFTDCEEIKGRRIRALLKWKGIHVIPILGRRLRHRWARKHGAVPERPSWVR